MIITGLDKPLDKEIECMLCGEPLKVTHHWIIERWAHPTCHDRCTRTWETERKTRKVEHQIPERFRDFDLARVADQHTARMAGNFSPDNLYHTLAIIGPSGMGKSRLMWHVVDNFFTDLGSGWPEYALFTDIMTDFDRTILSKLKTARYAFIDDIGSTDSFGRERALLQDVIRTRVQKGQWTFLSIDDPEFDKGFDDLFRGRATVVYVK